MHKYQRLCTTEEQQHVRQAGVFGMQFRSCIESQKATVARVRRGSLAEAHHVRVGDALDRMTFHRPGCTLTLRGFAWPTDKEFLVRTLENFPQMTAHFVDRGAVRFPKVFVSEDRSMVVDSHTGDVLWRAS